MKKILSFALLLFALAACNNSDRRSAESENDLDAARNFINAALAGDFRKARTYMLKDSMNEEHIGLVERVPLSPEEKKGLATASIRFLNVWPVSDSVTVIEFSNSYKNNPDTLKVVKQDGKWLVDLDYLFNHDKDSSTVLPGVKTPQ
jgi:hypothetical protein